MVDIPGEDLRQLRQMRANKAKPASGSVASARRAADRKSMLREDDGRRARGSGAQRDAQVNFKVSSDTKRRIVELARQLDRPMVWILERGLELVEAEAAKENG